MKFLLKNYFIAFPVTPDPMFVSAKVFTIITGQAGWQRL